MYLSPIQRGIQSAHLVHELFNIYTGLDPQYDAEWTDKELILQEWSMDHKTMIVLNGGYSETLKNLMDLFDNKQNSFPYCDFHEAEESLNGALTCVGIVLPERIYDGAALIRRDPELADAIRNTGGLVFDRQDGEVPELVEFNSWEVKLMEEMNNYSLA